MRHYTYFTRFRSYSSIVEILMDVCFTACKEIKSKANKRCKTIHIVVVDKLLTSLTPLFYPKVPTRALYNHHRIHFRHDLVHSFQTTPHVPYSHDPLYPDNE